MSTLSADDISASFDHSTLKRLKLWKILYCGHYSLTGITSITTFASVYNLSHLSHAIRCRLLALTTLESSSSFSSFPHPHAMSTFADSASTNRPLAVPMPLESDAGSPSAIAPISLPVNTAHRGAVFYGVENTLYAFEKAFDLGATAVELDVVCLSSGELAVFHGGVSKELPLEYLRLPELSACASCPPSLDALHEAA